MATTPSRSEELQELAGLIKDIRVAMLTTQAANGWLVSRPLHTRDTGFDGELWFFVAVESGKVDELLAHPQVNVAYVDPGEQHYVSIAGEASIVRDRERIDALWNDKLDTLYFKGGKDDPSLVLLRVLVQTAEVWNAGDNALSRAYNFVSAMVTGDGERMGERHRVDLRRH